MNTPQSLDLSELQLTALTREIGKLTELESLDLSRNLLTALPPEVGQLAMLKSLDLSGNLLTVLPAEITQLTALHSLNLAGNQLVALPPEIGQLTSLQSLNLAENRLTALPPEIGRLTALQSLVLTGNRLADFPSKLVLVKELAQIVPSQAAVVMSPKNATSTPAGNGPEGAEKGHASAVPDAPRTATNDFRLLSNPTWQDFSNFSLSLGAVLSVFAIVVLLGWDTLRQTISIEPLSVPKNFADEKGYGPRMSLPDDCKTRSTRSSPVLIDRRSNRHGHCRRRV
jgi:hypothetical protein